jgi:hypothetical protein
MATIDVGGRSSRRELNRELTLVPFIDFLLCIVAFLLVTAVWSQMARLEAQANVPGGAWTPFTRVRRPFAVGGVASAFDVVFAVD